ADRGERPRHRGTALARRRPVFHRQARNGGKVAIATNDGGISQSQSHGGGLNVNLLHRPAEATQLREPPSVLVGSLLVKRPEDEEKQVAANNVPRSVPATAPLHPGHDFAQDRVANPDLGSPSASFMNPFVNATPPKHAIEGRASIEEVT